MQTQVEGIPFGNSAPLTAPTRVCQTTLYTIDEVMQPTNSLADIPGFQDLSESPALFSCRWCAASALCSASHPAAPASVVAACSRANDLNSGS